jgi:hypothetical protein
VSRGDATASGVFSAAITGLDLLAGAGAGEREERAFVREIFIVTKLVSHAPGAALLAQAPIRSMLKVRRV